MEPLSLLRLPPLPGAQPDTKEASVHREAAAQPARAAQSGHCAGLRTCHSPCHRAGRQLHGGGVLSVHKALPRPKVPELIFQQYFQTLPRTWFALVLSDSNIL